MDEEGYTFICEWALGLSCQARPSIFGLSPSSLQSRSLSFQSVDCHSEVDRTSILHSSGRESYLSPFPSFKHIYSWCRSQLPATVVLLSPRPRRLPRPPPLPSGRGRVVRVGGGLCLAAAAGVPVAPTTATVALAVLIPVAAAAALSFPLLATLELAPPFFFPFPTPSPSRFPCSPSPG